MEQSADEARTDEQKEQSRKFETLVNAAPDLITSLPWGPDFEVGTFQRPDFTALEILSFATGGIPAGISGSPCAPRWRPSGR